ncbi:XXYS1_4_G0015150.mRNA.1.CDS.1 [Saccharomyces cerevisiae]|nr:EM14S01-3B_G0012530.mRNA.1.CDS.1 [Saccharomyces cerevisiae]CAD6644803.1 XXYS1_4_G0015150.mRNA.1.CDS.1 [Saccharomyces cerevisiae]CAI4750017.1 CEI_1a_G0046930.mRNA.1.CDS.1 [Saccharomyces cerevisiae]CAI4757136.1 AMH_1a_G0047030.mRNA.1.CDS.1 [Saccharomyces cerevisiae]CAI6867750.1 AMH_1a_G0047030.mRNA.1.CDS.1 [Saccharomyces cerevisiae]
MSEKVNSDFEDFSSDEETDQHNVLIQTKKQISSKDDIFSKKVEDIESENESDIEEEQKQEKKEDVEQPDKENGKKLDREVEEQASSTTSLDLKTEKLRQLVKSKAAKKSKHKTGVVYFSSIPPYMKPAKMRQILTRFGEVDRLFLKKEDDQRYKQRVKGGGNKKNKYEEGWAEFIRKRDAKLCAETLNGNIIGGKKGTFYHDDILNVKYLPGFKWADLTEQIARENDIRQAKLEMEISQANKLNAEFIRNVEQSKMIQNIKNSRKRAGKEEESADSHPHREFKQRRVETSRANAPSDIKQQYSGSKDLGNVLTNLL